jgi:hypothetical protein
MVFSVKRSSALFGTGNVIAENIKGSSSKALLVTGAV